MAHTIQLIVLIALAAGRPNDNYACPVLLVSGEADSDTIAVTFRNVDRLPIRRLEFNCKLADARADKAHARHCLEPNASFVPRTEFTVSYAYPRGARGPLLVSVKSVMFSDGHTWKPSKSGSCRVLKIQLPRAKRVRAASGPN
jgi:hypothetical protein